MIEQLPDLLAISVAEALDLAIKVALFVIILWLIHKGSPPNKIGLILACCLISGCTSLGQASIDINIGPMGLSLTAQIDELKTNGPEAVTPEQTPAGMDP